ncbi:MAG: hypothetical protein RSC43_06325 [Clostridia bacterium]
MSKVAMFLLKFLLVMSAIGAALYWFSYFLAATGQRLSFSCGRIPAKPAQADDEAASEVSSPCGDAVCAIDMCMPF